MSRKLYGKCEQVAIVDKVSNFSDHLPVNVKLNVKVCHYSSSENVRLYAKWDDESNKMYYNNTRDGLYMLDDGCIIVQMLSVMLLVIIHVLMIIVKKLSEFCMTRRFGVV